MFRKLLIAPLLAAVLVAACQPLSFPFQPDPEEKALNAPPPASVSITEPAPPPVPRQERAKIMIPPVIGPPRLIGLKISSNVSRRLQSIGLKSTTRSTTHDTYVLKGTAMLDRFPRRPANLRLEWELVSPEGLSLATFGDQIAIAAATSGTGWPRSLPRTADSLSSKIAAHVSALIKEADQAPPAVPSAQVAAAELPGSVGQAPRRDRLRPRLSVADSSLPPVTVPDVDGAPGDGAATLAEAMRAALTEARVPVLDDLTDDTYLVVGDVFITEDESDFATVSVTWTLLRPDGQQVGSVIRSNKVGLDSIEPHWGPVARNAAQIGLAELVRMLRKSGPAPRRDR